jgi:hypothetical protein
MRLNANGQILFVYDSAHLVETSGNGVLRRGCAHFICAWVIAACNSLLALKKGHDFLQQYCVQSAKDSTNLTRHRNLESAVKAAKALGDLILDFKGAGADLGFLELLGIEDLIQEAIRQDLHS